MPRHNDLFLKGRALKSSADVPPEESVVQAEGRWITVPLPSADELSRYEDVSPGAAERLLLIHKRQISLLEHQVHHRSDLERRVIFGDVARSYVGLGLGFVICLAGVYYSYRLGLHGHDVLAATTFVTEIAAMTGIFVYGSSSRRAERSHRIQSLLQEQHHHEDGEQVAPPRLLPNRSSIAKRLSRQHRFVGAEKRSGGTCVKFSLLT